MATLLHHRDSPYPAKPLPFTDYGTRVASRAKSYPKTSPTNPATRSAIAGAAVNPGDSIPTN